MPRYEPVIGLEIHAQLLTATKMFCGCRAEFGAEPNTNVCPVCLGLPGALPSVNAKAVEFAVKMGLATDCKITHRSVFARKNYFYPDCPKNYQITQYETPLCKDGCLNLGSYGEFVADSEGGNGAGARIRIKRIHLEEDAGKLLHGDGDNTSAVDMNRAGVPLIEIVTEPDIRSPRQASRVMHELHSILRYLDICDGNMEEGSLRCDANVSVREVGSSGFGVNTEIKNVNSFKAVERALEFEMKRQEGILRRGEAVVRATLLWDGDSGTCRIMRSKEEADDYRYFPEPDLPELEVTDGQVARLAGGLPELPRVREKRFVTQYGVPRYDAQVLTGTRAIADLFEDTVRTVAAASGGEHTCAQDVPGQSKEETTGASAGTQNALAVSKAVSNWIMGEVLRELNERKIELSELEVTSGRLAGLINEVLSERITGPVAKEVFREMVETGVDSREIITRNGLERITDKAVLSGIIEDVLDGHPNEVRAYHCGKSKLLQYLLGQVMTASRGRAHPKETAMRLREALEKRRDT